ncbi:hypothetical protein JCM17380_11840 [Desulfosporosinus burensis]
MLRRELVDNKSLISDLWETERLNMIFACHQNPKSEEMIKSVVEQLKKHANEVFLKVNQRNERIYIVPVRDENGDLLGYIERFEMNLQK